MVLTTRTDYTQLVMPDAVHRRVYTDPAIFDAEMQCIFGRTWVFVGHESEVPNPGDYKTDRIARQPIIMTRHTDGQVYVLFNVCRHRGATVCQLPEGNATQLRCIYHGWTYRNNGQLMSVPHVGRFGDDFHPREYGLLPLPRVDSYRGFVFASLSADGPDLHEHLGRAKHYIDVMVDRAPAGAIQATKPLRYQYDGNWKLQNENYADNYHPAILHQSTFEVGREIMVQKYRDRPAQARGDQFDRSFGYGHGATEYHNVRQWYDAFDDPDYLAALAARHGTDEAQRIAETDIHVMIYPNLLLHSRMNHYRVIKPLAVDRTEIQSFPCKLVGAPDHMNAIIIAYAAQHCSAGGEVQVDDLKAFAAVQEGLQVEAFEWVLFKLRGEHERLNAHGEWEGTGMSELIQRGQYREWARLMAEE